MNDKALQVLVVENNALLRAFLRALFERCQIAPAEAPDGEAAVAEVLRHHYDLVLIDLLTPEMDAAEVIRRIRQEVPPEWQPVIIVHSAEAADVSGAGWRGLGADGFLARPCRLQDIRDLVQEVRTRTTDMPGREIALLDDDLIREWVDGWDADFQDLLADFIGDVYDMHDALARLGRSPPYAEAIRMAHSLKGSSSNFGFMRYAHRMADVEARLQAGEPVDDTTMKEARQILDTSIVAIRKWPRTEA